MSGLFLDAAPHHESLVHHAFLHEFEKGRGKHQLVHPSIEHFCISMLENRRNDVGDACHLKSSQTIAAPVLHLHIFFLDLSVLAILVLKILKGR